MVHPMIRSGSIIDSPDNRFVTTTILYCTMSGGLNDLDLSVEADVRRYLENTAYKSEEVTPLSGGFTNFVFRLKLERPYLGKTRLVLKHGKGYVKEHHMISVKLDRQVGAEIMVNI